MSVVGRLIFLLLVVALLRGVPAHAVDWDLESDTWVATDALGRSLPGAAECGTPKAGKTAGIFYFLWLNGSHAGVFDITKLLAANPTNPAWGPRWEFHHWGESELGYYTIDEDYVIRRHCQLLVDAGVDAVCFDVTNAFTYTSTYMKLCAIYHKIRAEGGKTPQICFVVNTNPAATVQQLYDDLYSKNLYPELWFYWSGKPLILSPPDGLSQTLLDFFTIRKTWAWNAGLDNWTFIDNYPQNYGYHTAGVPEEISVTIAQHPISNIGRSFHGGSQPTTDQYNLCSTTGEGLCFAEQWTRALSVSPPFLFITGWNEWIAQRFIEGLDYEGISLCGRPLNDGETYFVDQYNQEYSRDIEPMKGGHTDSYYYQMIDGIRRYKGVRTAPAPSPVKTIAIDGDFSDWADVEPEYRDHVGDTEHRNALGYAGANTYVNSTGRNDIVRAKVAHDADNAYFYVETGEDITSCTDPNWMLLFINSDSNQSTGWQGYDYLVNFPPVDATTTTVKSASSGWNWTQAGTAPYRVAANRMEISIPLSMIGETGQVAFDFHWADNIQQTDDIAQFFTNGDSAPNRRANYRYDTSSAGPPWEFASGVEGWTAAHSVYGFKQLSGVIQGTILGSDPYVNAPSSSGIDADTYRTVQISMRNSSATANTAEIRWKTLANASYSSTRSVSFPITCDNAYHTYTLDMSSNAEWSGWVYALQLHPTGASSGSFYVDHIRVYPDTVGPTGSISINSDAATTPGSAVTLTLAASDVGTGVSMMRFSNDGSTWSAWEDFATTESWSLAAGDGDRTAYVQFRDRSMNRSATYSDTITVQGVAPTGTLAINAGAAYASSASVTLNLSATGYSSPVTEMKLANLGASWLDWEPYAETRSWTLLGSDGTKTIYAQFRDASGRVSQSVYDSIVLDTAAPSGTLAINAGAAYTNSANVTLDTTASDNLSGVGEVRFANMGFGWGSWEPYAAAKSWTVGSGDGTRSVYAQFRDRAGNVSASVLDGIIIDTTPPGAPGTPTDAGVYTGGASVVFNWTAATDNRSGIDTYVCQTSTSPTGEDLGDSVGNVLTRSIIGSIGSRYYCRVRARDAAGNVGDWSGWSDGVMVVAHPSIGVAVAKGFADGDSVGLPSMVVTAIFSDRFYIEAPDRSSGIRVAPADGMPSGLVIGSLVDVAGTLRVTPAGERCIDSSVAAPAP